MIKKLLSRFKSRYPRIIPLKRYTYIVGRWVRRRAMVNRAVVLVFVAIITLAGFLIWRDGKKVSVQEYGSATTTATVAPAQPVSTMISEPYFQMQLPAGWKEVNRTKDTAPYIEWSSDAIQRQRFIRLYTNGLPSNFAVSRFLPVEIAGNRIIPGDVSDRCENFTIHDNKNAIIPALWNGATFQCDLRFPGRNTVGIGSKDNIFKATLTDTKSQAHALYFYYVDDTLKPDFKIFIDALTSVQMK